MRFLRKISLLAAVLMMISTLSHGGERAEGPVAVFLSPGFEFDPVGDGSEVIHDFIVRNTGSAVLDILEVKTG